MKTVSIHQPNFVPWLGYFYKIAQSDVFVILDDVQYTKNSFINRNKIKTPQGPKWLTIPVAQAGKFGQNINETHISNREKSLKKVVRTVEQNYKKAPYFDRYFEGFSKICQESPDIISELNNRLIIWAMDSLSIQTEVRYSSQLGVDHLQRTERLTAICEHLGADHYFSGFGGMKYQDEEIFRQANIQVKVSGFKHPVYDQLWGEFVHGLSILDLLFNCGPQSLDVLTNQD